MTTRTNPCLVELPPSLRNSAERLSEQAGTSLDQFVADAVAEKIFAQRKARADRDAFRRILNREGGQPPSPEDELPPDLAHLGRRENWR